MRRTSIMIEVDDEVYTSVVEPLKRNKSFAKLVTTLLNGYINDSYIKSYADDTLEEVHKAVVGAFEESVSDMEASLASMGLYSDMLGAQVKTGYDKFQRRGKQQAEQLRTGGDVPVTGNSKEIEDLNRRVSGLEQTISDGLSKIMEMLNSNGGQVSAGVSMREQPIKVTRESKSAVKVPVGVGAGYSSGGHGSVFADSDLEEDSGSESEIDEVTANEFMASLMGDYMG